jgi:hypothetical protein
MNSDNPYAAPQTVELRATGDLPVADAAGRNLFPELDTRQLGRLADYSHTMQLMTRLWVIPLVISGFLLTNYQKLPAPVQGTLLLIVPLLGLRMVAGLVRGTWWRYYAALLDGLVVFGFLGGMVVGLVTSPGPSELALFVPLSIVMIFLGLIAVSSFFAHCCAPELFGPQRYHHHELMQEIDYRKQHGIG